MRPFSGFERGEKIQLNPDDEQTQMYVRGGRIKRMPNE